MSLRCDMGGGFRLQNGGKEVLPGNNVPSVDDYIVEKHYTATAEQRWTEAKPMPDCKWMQDEICVNADCPMCADFCPVPDIPGVCRFEEREEHNEQS